MENENWQKAKGRKKEVNKERAIRIWTEEKKE